MAPSRLFAIAFIYCCTAVAWSILGGSLVSRTGESDQRIAKEVAQLWGGRHEQRAPEAWVERPREVVKDVEEKDAKGVARTRRVTETVVERAPLALEESRLEGALRLEPRQRGLLWYDTYAIDLRARYRLTNPDPVPRTLAVSFVFPSGEAIYDGFRFRVAGQQAPPAEDLTAGLLTKVTVPARGSIPVELNYSSRGLGPWTYAFAEKGVSQVHDFVLTLTTDFTAIDFPAGTLSPTEKVREGKGWRLAWKFESLVTGQRLGVDPPDRLNPGPFAARVTFFAPVSLLFFLTVLVLLGLLRDRNLHPMNYFFLAAAFFSFHLLLAYLVDHVNVHLAFAISALTSVFLVVSYLRLVGGMRFALLEAGLAQTVFLVLFSYSFFFEGLTGLTITVGAVTTLFVLMQLTGRVDWSELLARRASEGPRP